VPLGWRPAADLCTAVPPTRRIMPFIMPARAGSTVFFEQDIDLSRAEPWLADFRARTGLRATLLHLVIHALGRTIHERPRLNRFTAGGRYWQRRGIWVSFSAKKALSDDQPLFVVKREVDPRATFEQLVRTIEASIGEGRSDRPSTTDRELKVFLALPPLLLGPLARLLVRLDHWGLLPGFFMRSDPMFASVFVANLGSVGLDAAFHHLYEYGNIPIFLVMGRIREHRVTFRWSFDDRVEDGLYCARSLERFRARVEDPGAAEA
jgi:hypothetical protein